MISAPIDRAEVLLVDALRRLRAADLALEAVGDLHPLARCLYIAHLRGAARDVERAADPIATKAARAVLARWAT